MILSDCPPDINNGPFDEIASQIITLTLKSVVVGSNLSDDNILEILKKPNLT